MPWDYEGYGWDKRAETHCRQSESLSRVFRDPLHTVRESLETHCRQSESLSRPIADSQRVSRDPLQIVRVAIQSRADYEWHGWDRHTAIPAGIMSGKGLK